MSIKGVVKRPEPSSGLPFRTFADTSGELSQGVAIIDNAGDQLGVPGNPLVTQLTPAQIIVYRTGAVAEASAVLAATATRLSQVRVILDQSSTQDLWLMLFDSSSVPIDGATPDWRSFVPRAGQADETFDGSKELVFSTGLVAALSTTVATLTLAGAVGFFHSRRS